jgi:hypothetical protein
MFSIGRHDNCVAQINDEIIHLIRLKIRNIAKFHVHGRRRNACILIVMNQRSDGDRIGSIIADSHLKRDWSSDH